MWVQQDGATTHIVRASMTVVREMFPGHVISQRGSLLWPAWSPDLSVCNYFLSGYLRVKIFINRPCTVHELKVATVYEIMAMPPDMVRCSVTNFNTRLQECMWRDGKHLDGIIFKTKSLEVIHKMAYLLHIMTNKISKRNENWLHYTNLEGIRFPRRPRRMYHGFGGVHWLR
jgi:hypothetical protein